MECTVNIIKPKQVVLDMRPAISNSPKDLMLILMDCTRMDDGGSGLTQVVENICINEMAFRN
jgi:hypothetical protein